MSAPYRITGVAGDAVHMETEDSTGFTIDAGNLRESFYIANQIVEFPEFAGTLRALFAVRP